MLGEHAIYEEETGQFLSGSFIDHPMAHADVMRGIRCGEHNVPTATTAMGAKGVGESCSSGALPTVMNAILNTVRPAHVTHLELWRAITQAGVERVRRGDTNGRPGWGVVRKVYLLSARSGHSRTRS